MDIVSFIDYCTTLLKGLKELQQQDIVSRHQYNEMSIRVEYDLTKKGRSLIPILDTISDWAIAHSDEDIYQVKHVDKVHRAKFH